MSEFIEELTGLKNKEQFAEWLWKSLGDLHRQRPSNGKKNQRELYHFMITNGMESPVEVLAVSYRRYVREREKELYRKAIGLALRKCAQEANTEQVNQIAGDLIYLLGYIGAVEALDGLLELLAGEHPELLYACMANIQAIKPCDELFHFMAELVQGPYFDDGYIFSAIKIMVDCRLESSMEIVDGLGRRISKLYKKVKERGTDEESVYWETVTELFASNGEIMKKILFYSTEQKQSG